MYKFTRMEWWRSSSPTGFGDAYAGFCEDGSILLTFDVRGNVPVFSDFCRVGSQEGHRPEAFVQYRQLFGTLDGYSIKDVKSCEYTILNGKKILKFVL